MIPPEMRKLQIEQGLLKDTAAAYDRAADVVSSALPRRGGELMARQRNLWRGTRSSLYRTARIMGDLEAIAKGPKAMARRAGRRAAGRSFGGLLRKLFR